MGELTESRNVCVMHSGRAAYESGGPVTPPLFVYGSLMHQATLASLLGRSFRFKPLRATLFGYKRVEPRDYGYYVAVADPLGRIEGHLLTGLSAADMERLDVYEEVALEHYCRQPVKVVCWIDGSHSRRLDASTYVAGAALLKWLSASESS